MRVVEHAAACRCAPCAGAELRRRAEERRREATRELVPVLFELRGLRKAQPGTLPALKKLGGGR